MTASGADFLISSSGCSRNAFCRGYVCSSVVFGFVPFGSSFIGVFSPPEGILIFIAPTYSCICSVAGGRHNGLKEQENILWGLKYQQVEKR